MEPTVDRFRALARSSPWRWRTLRLVARWSGPTEPVRAEPVRAEVRRPDAIRIEGLDGRLLHVEQRVPPAAAVLRAGRGAPPDARPWIGEVVPERHADGLVARRPGWDVAEDPGDPMYRDYQWVALLDPVELADGEDGEGGSIPEGVRPVEHRGRPAWEAVVRPTPAYTPRCSCCALLLSEVSDARERAVGGVVAADADPDLRYPEAHLVRLDVATGVCVRLVQLGGSRDGRAVDLAIEAVDEPMGDERFAPPPRRRFVRTSRRG
jgi:hypothetical protein